MPVLMIRFQSPVRLRESGSSSVDPRSAQIGDASSANLSGIPRGGTRACNFVEKKKKREPERERRREEKERRNFGLESNRNPTRFDVIIPCARSSFRFSDNLGDSSRAAATRRAPNDNVIRCVSADIGIGVAVARGSRRSRRKSVVGDSFV